MVGAGLTMEGIFQNYIQYQFMIDRIWSSDSLEEQQWSFLDIQNVPSNFPELTCS